jgi:hypothetical protein
MSVVTRGDREISARFEAFPQRAKAKLQERITALTSQLEERVRDATPVRTGLLKSEIKLSIYGSNEQGRVAGYVSVYAGGNSSEYAKAATLEYGSNKPRKLGARSSSLAARLTAGGRNLARRISTAPHIEAFRYLRGPFEQMKPEIEASLNEGIAEAVAEGEA